MASKKEVKEIEATQGEVIVSSTLMGKTTQKGEPLTVRPFITTPGQVEVHKGAWFPTGDMAGAKVDITVRMPCYVEEISSAFMQVNRLVEALMDKEVARMTGETDGKE